MNQPPRPAPNSACTPPADNLTERGYTERIDMSTNDMSNAEQPVSPGWTGRFYEDLAVGDVYRSRFGHTVTEADNALFTHLTHNTNALHFDAHYAGNSRWGRILVNSTFTLALITGMSVNDVTEHAMANLGWEEIKLPNPVFLGDTLYCETEIVARRDSKSYPEAGIVRFRSRGINQTGDVVIDYTRSALIYRRGASPQSASFPEPKTALTPSS